MAGKILQNKMIKIKEIKSSEIDVILDLRYATKNNICHQILYNKAQAYLHQEAYDKLEKAVEYAKNLGYKIKIFDAYRPFAVQKFMFDFFAHDKKFEGFVSDPQTGATPHCRGVAIDLTLCDLAGNEIDMGSDFDDFSDLAFHNSAKISLQQFKNRNTLLGIMAWAGFDYYAQEWWHYQLFEPRKYPILSLSLN